MSELITCDLHAALKTLPEPDRAALEAGLPEAREAVLQDARRAAEGCTASPQKQPLDAAFIDWPDRLLQDMKENGADSLIAQIERCATRLQQTVDTVVVIGIGGSYMGMRALFEALADPFHNERTREERGGIPRLYFAGWNVDSDRQQALLDLLENRVRRCGSDGPAGRTALIVISKSGGTLEPAIAFRNLRAFVERHFSSDVQDLIVPVTGTTGRLRTLAEQAGFRDVFSIPEGIGGRFSVLTAVGLLPAAVSGINIRRLLQGAAEMTEHFRSAPFEHNAVLRHAAIGHLLERQRGLTIRVLSTWGSHLEAVGLWYDQLLAESLGKQERGATPITGVNTRDLHSRGQQHQEGRRDKLIVNLLPGPPRHPTQKIPLREDDADDLNRFARHSPASVLEAAIAGTSQAYAADARPTVDLKLPGITPHSLGQLFQLLMLSTVVEGELIGINPYGQPGVEAYKKNMIDILLRGGADTGDSET